MTSKKIVQFMLTSILTGALLVASGCSKSDKEQGATSGDGQQTKADNKKVILLYSFKAGSLDPHNGSIPQRAGITETLVRLNGDLKLQGWLATEWKATDATTWVFTIRENVTFQDGTALTAASVKASFERGISASKNLANALKIASMVAEGQTLTIKTTEPHPALPSELANPIAAVISAEAEQQVGKDAFNQAPVGTGPFKVKKFTPNVEVALERYDAYWGGKPKLSEASFKFNEDANVRALALQSKEADIVYNIPAESIEAIKKNEAFKVESVTGLRVHFIMYNYRKPYLQDLKVRQALNLLLNRESIAQDIMLGHGTPANGPFNSKLPFGSSEPIQKLDTAKARILLEEAGFKAGADGRLQKDGKLLSLELITYKGRPELPLMAQLLQSDAAKAGVTVSIKTVENVDTYLKDNKDWDMATYSVITSPRGDGGYYLNSALTEAGALNQGGINIPRLNDLIKQLNASSVDSERIELTKKATSVIQEEAAQSYGVFPNIIVGMNKRVKDWAPTAEEYYMLNHTMDTE